MITASGTVMDKHTILNSLDIKSFYSSEVPPLKANGSGMGQAPCPFCSDNKTSLSINLKSGGFRCFNCDTKGDIFYFVMKKKKLDFSGAKALLAKEAGLTQEPKREIAATCTSTDESGNLLDKTLYQLAGKTEPKLILLWGYSGSNTDYNEAKKPKGGATWTYITKDSLSSRVQTKEWAGLVIPEGRALFDVDDPPYFTRIHEGLKHLKIKHIAIRTPNGGQLLFKDTRAVKTQSAKMITVGGFLCDYRLPGKGYIVLPMPHTEGREIIHADEELDLMPSLFIPVRRFNEEKDDERILPVIIAQGMRDDTLFRHAARVKEWNHKYRLNLTDKDRMDVLQTINLIFCEPPLSYREVEQKIRSAERNPPMSEQQIDKPEWIDPIPFDDYSLLPDFPVDALPGPGREMVKAVSEVNQVDPGMTASIYLSALSACMARKGDVTLVSHKEPLNIYTCSILPSGERKSSTMDTMTKPLYEYQAKQQKSMQDTIRDELNTHKIREARLDRLQKAAAKADDFAERKTLEKEAAEVAKEISENPVPKAPLFIVDDITPEALGIHMSENNERMAVMSAEGGIFEIIAGRYNDNIANLDLCLKAHAGDSWSSHRVGREAKTMQSPALTMGLTVQPEVIRGIGVNRQFRGRGLLARFSYSFCKSQVGYRGRQVRAVPEAINRAYQKHIEGLMDIPMTTNTLKLSQDAQALWDEFYNDVEADLRKGGSLQYLTDWGSKLPGAIARIAGLLHFAEHGFKASELPISVNIVSASCLIGAYYKEHALATFGIMEVDSGIESAKKILDYLSRHSPETFKGRDVLRHTNIKTMDGVTPGLKILIERGYIREAEIIRSVTGRPEAITYEVNPKIKIPRKP